MKIAPARSVVQKVTGAVGVGCFQTSDYWLWWCDATELRHIAIHVEEPEAGDFRWVLTERASGDI